jgi:hypothetical protein
MFYINKGHLSVNHWMLVLNFLACGNIEFDRNASFVQPQWYVFSCCCCCRLSSWMWSPRLNMNDKKVSAPSQSRFGKILQQYQQLVDTTKTYYCKFIHIIHARDFLAEFLGTFILVVRMWLRCTYTFSWVHNQLCYLYWMHGFQPGKKVHSLITLDHTFQLSLCSLWWQIPYLKEPCPVLASWGQTCCGKNWGLKLKGTQYSSH